MLSYCVQICSNYEVNINIDINYDMLETINAFLIYHHQNIELFVGLSANNVHMLFTINIIETPYGLLRNGNGRWERERKENRTEKNVRKIVSEPYANSIFE